MEVTRPTIMEVSLSAFEHNINQIKKYVGENVKLMPVIKANAYGTYINKVNEMLNQFDIVAVATVDEAVEIRMQGYEKEIFVLNQPYKDEIEKIVEHNITVGVSSDSFIEELSKIESTVTIHVEIGTGMGRTGINPKRVEEYINKIKSFKNIKIEGIYTHLSSADSDEEYTKKQLFYFENAVNKAKELLGEIKYVHCNASNGILNFTENSHNLVRPGLIMYGYEPFDGAKEKMDLKPISKLKSRITFLKEVEEGASIGYSRTFITKRKTKVATIPIGYADGLKRALSNKGHVYIKGHIVPIIGSVCMDGFMVDVTDVEGITVGDEVYIWDNENITLEEVAETAGTMNYEMLCTISNRVPRVFIKN